MEAESVVEAARDLSPTMYDKLRSEASTPFRTVRLSDYPIHDVLEYRIA